MILGVKDRMLTFTSLALFEGSSSTCKTTTFSRSFVTQSTKGQFECVRWSNSPMIFAQNFLRYCVWLGMGLFVDLILKYWFDCVVWSVLLLIFLFLISNTCCLVFLQWKFYALFLVFSKFLLWNIPQFARIFVWSIEIWRWCEMGVGNVTLVSLRWKYSKSSLATVVTEQQLLLLLL